MLRRVLSTLAILLITGGPAAAQGPSSVGSASIHVPTLLRIEVTDAHVSFPSPSLQDFDVGFILASSAPPGVRTRGNVPHRVQVAAADDLLRGASADATKPVADLQWSTGDAWTALATTPADLAALPPGHHTAAAEVRFRLLLDLATDRPDAYDVALVFTAVPQ